MTFEVTIEPGSNLYDQLHSMMEAGDTVTLRCGEPWSERIFEVGDKVTVEFDNGSGPAKIIEVHGEYVRVSYQRGRYTTSLHRTSVRTTHRREHPATVEVVT